MKHLSNTMFHSVTHPAMRLHTHTQSYWVCSWNGRTYKKNHGHPQAGVWSDLMVNIGRRGFQKRCQVACRMSHVASMHESYRWCLYHSGLCPFTTPIRAKQQIGSRTCSLIWQTRISTTAGQAGRQAALYGLGMQERSLDYGVCVCAHHTQTSRESQRAKIQNLHGGHTHTYTQ